MNAAFILYAYQCCNEDYQDAHTFLLYQIEAHVGSVNDLAFAYPNKQLCIVTCGEDRSIKVCFPLLYVFRLI